MLQFSTNMSFCNKIYARKVGQLNKINISCGRYHTIISSSYPVKSDSIGTGMTWAMPSRTHRTWSSNSCNLQQVDTGILINHANKIPTLSYYIMHNLWQDRRKGSKRP